MGSFLYWGNLGEKAHPECGQHHSIGWASGPNKEVKGNWAPKFTCLCFLTMGSMWLDASFCGFQGFFTLNFISGLGTKVNSSPICFCQVFGYSNERFKYYEKDSVLSHSWPKYMRQQHLKREKAKPSSAMGNTFTLCFIQRSVWISQSLPNMNLDKSFHQCSLVIWF